MATKTKPRPQVGTVTLHRCSDCNHKHLDHSRQAGKSCSMEWCPCRKTEIEVRREEPGVEAPTYAVVMGGGTNR